MKNRVQFIFNFISVCALFVLLCFVVFGAVTSPTVYAAESEAVLRDLRKDKTFDENDYPYVADDYGLHVIQIAESANKELFIYAYQPCHDTYDLIGTKISISYGYSVNGSGLTPKLYNLRLISTSGTLDKYYVDGFTVPNDGDRYYNIVEIFRSVNEVIDDLGDENSPITDKAYPVGQQWYVHDINDTKSYTMGVFNVLPVETIFSGCVRLDSVVFWNWAWDNSPDACDVWFYAFDQDTYIIDHVVDGTLSYSSQYVSSLRGMRDSGYQELDTLQENKAAKIKEIDTVSFDSKGLFGSSYKWNRIMSAQRFVSTLKEQKANLKTEVENKVKNAEWVFCFLDTRVDYFSSGDFMFEKSYVVSDVGLLQLHFFDMRGKEYDLGVVNSLVDPDDSISGGTMEYLRQSWEYFWERFIKIIGAILALILLVVLLNLITPVKNVLKFIFRLIAFVITAPFKFLKSIFKKGG